MERRQQRVADKSFMKTHGRRQLITMSIKTHAQKLNIGNLADDHRQGEIATTFDLGDRFWPAHALAFATVNAPVAVATGRAVSSSQAVARTKATVLVTW